MWVLLIYNSWFRRKMVQYNCEHDLVLNGHSGLNFFGLSRDSRWPEQSLISAELSYQRWHRITWRVAICEQAFCERSHQQSTWGYREWTSSEKERLWIASPLSLPFIKRRPFPRAWHGAASLVKISRCKHNVNIALQSKFEMSAGNSICPFHEWEITAAMILRIVREFDVPSKSITCWALDVSANISCPDGYYLVSAIKWNVLCLSTSYQGEWLLPLLKCMTTEPKIMQYEWP
jgi:hypothetical protein